MTIAEEDVEAVARAICSLYDNPDSQSGPVYMLATGVEAPLGEQHPRWHDFAPDARAAIGAFLSFQAEKGLVLLPREATIRPLDAS